MKMLLRIFLSIIGLALVAVFWWGFAGFIESGSSGSPPVQRLRAFWIGGVGYLLLLAIAAAFEMLRGDNRNSSFGVQVARNVKLTGGWLLACFPAAFFFVGLLAPPFILSWSAITLFRSSIQCKE